MRVLILALVVAASVAAADDRLPVLATIERSACFGTCPSDVVTVYGDGRVSWEGRNFVKAKGTKHWQLTVTELEALRKAFSDAKYLDLGEGYDCPEWTDKPSVKTSYREGTRFKAINHDHGCRSKSGMAELTALEDKFDAIVKSAQWVGTKDERSER